VDDCRYPNEYAALADRGFVFVRLQDESRTPFEALEEEAEEGRLQGDKAEHAPEVPESERHYPFFACDFFLPWASTVSNRIVNLKEMMYD
jgi:hypothetical protein